MADETTRYTLRAGAGRTWHAICGICGERTPDRADWAMADDDVNEHLRDAHRPRPKDGDE